MIKCTFSHRGLITSCWCYAEMSNWRICEVFLIISKLSREFFVTLNTTITWSVSLHISDTEPVSSENQTPFKRPSTCLALFYESPDGMFVYPVEQCGPQLQFHLCCRQLNWQTARRQVNKSPPWWNFITQWQSRCDGCRQGSWDEYWGTKWEKLLNFSQISF